ncbi:MAG TPA: class D sortase [Bryobacteraceae bacterium]|nr:class D sortase [Bryobacteraceae bacterium]
MARRAGLVLVVVGLALALYAIYDGYAGRIYQAWRGPEVDRELESVPEAPSTSIAPRPHLPTYKKGSAIGRLEIPRLGLSTVVLEGSDAGTLRLGVGRVANSGVPGYPGNVVLAGHRDTFFRPLREIRAGDRISLRTKEGTFSYTVDWTRVVKPTDVGVIMPTASPSLTLVTCYPFYYIGAAPERFIVRAVPPLAVSSIQTPSSGKPSPFDPPRKPVMQPTRVAASRSAAAEPAANRAPAEVAEPGPPDQPGLLKRAWHKIGSVFSSHRDTLE